VGSSLWRSNLVLTTQAAFGRSADGRTWLSQVGGATRFHYLISGLCLCPSSGASAGRRPFAGLTGILPGWRLAAACCALLSCAGRRAPSSLVFAPRWFAGRRMMLVLEDAMHLNVVHAYSVLGGSDLIVVYVRAA
jgi:hypothetical protein